MAASSTLVLVTGASGYIGAWCVKTLLEQGYKVRGTVRDPNNTSKNGFLLALPGAEERLQLVKADLNVEAGWQEVVSGCDYVFHVASPYTLSYKDPQKDLVDPAINGTRFVFQACAKTPSVKRIVLTSSVAAISDCFDDWKDHVYNENDWNSTSSLHRNAYYYSKTVAERWAWEFIAAEKPTFDLAVINPFLVIGPALDFSTINQSVSALDLVLSGGQPVTLPLNEALVDVRDVALMHVRAMQVAEAHGHRFFGLSQSMTNQEMCIMIRDVAPEKLKHHCPTHAPLPLPAVALGLYARAIQSKGAGDYAAHNAHKWPKFDTSPSTQMLKMDWIPIQNTIKDTVDWLVEFHARAKQAKLAKKG